MLPFVASMPSSNIKTLLKHLNSASFHAKAGLIKAFASHSGAHSCVQATLVNCPNLPATAYSQCAVIRQYVRRKPTNSRKRRTGC
jgi:hypothetical protein